MAEVWVKDLGASKNKKRTRLIKLPQELVVEILSWLPPEYLWPLRCVSKTWFQLLTTDPHFPNLHISRSVQLKRNSCIISTPLHTDFHSFHLALQHTYCNNAIKLNLPFQQNFCQYTVYGISNGLICISILGCPNTKKHLFIWNPLTKHCISLPYSTPPPRFPGFFNTHVQFAFGFHRGSNRYKVVMVYGEYDDKEMCFHSQVSVCNLAIDSNWRTVVNDIQYDMSRTMDSPLVKGCVHWLGSRTLMLSQRAIVAFDLGNEVCRELLPPKHVNLDVPYTDIGELGGFLCVLTREKGDLHIWVMRKYGVVSSWSKQFKIRQPAARGPLDLLKLLGVVPHSGDIILANNMEKLILYSPQTKSSRYIKDFGFELYGVYSFTGSLISPIAISGAAPIIT